MGGEFMIISRFEIDDCTYFNFHAEQAYEGTFGSFFNYNIQKEGIFQSTLTKSTVDSIIKEINENEIKTTGVFFEFKGIESLQINQNISFKENIFDKLSCKAIQLSNVKRVIVESLDLLNYVDSSDNNYNDITINNEKNKVFTSSQQAFESYFHNILTSKYVVDKTKFHHSSSVYINKFIDIKRLITEDKNLILFTIYMLALNMITPNENRDWTITKDEKEIILFSQNMNCSFIASILSQLLLLDVTLIDHVGPINKIYSSFDNLINKNKKYLVVSDMVCLGSEVRIAKNLIEFSGGEYIGNVSIIRVNTMKKEDRYSNVETIYIIEKGNNKIGYSIKTALVFSKISNVIVYNSKAQI
jgi:hypothetical protein